MDVSSNRHPARCLCFVACPDAKPVSTFADTLSQIELAEGSIAFMRRVAVAEKSATRRLQLAALPHSGTYGIVIMRSRCQEIENRVISGTPYCKATLQ
jgi:hypothetical protein